MVWRLAKTHGLMTRSRWDAPRFWQTLAIALVVCLAVGGRPLASAKPPSLYAPAVAPQPQKGDAPRQFAASMYKDILARMAFGQPESAVEPLLYLVHEDPDLPALQNAAAVAILTGQSLRRQRAADFAARAVQLDPDNPVFQVTRVLADPTRSRLTAKGDLELTAAAAAELKAAGAQLEHGSPNNRLLAQDLQSVSANAGDQEFPFVFAAFNQLTQEPGLLLTTPDDASFGRLEQAITGRIEQLTAEADEARKSSDQAKAWLQDLETKARSASPAERSELQIQSEQKREELEHWTTALQEKVAALDDETARFIAFQNNDYPTLAKLRIASEGAEAPQAAPVQLTVNASSGTPVNPNHSYSLRKYYALVIGNDNYQYAQKLKTAVGDAQAVAAVLRQNYGFDVRVLQDATRSEMIDALYQLRALTSDTDNILIFYAGHGYYDEATQTGYWIPVDGTRDSPANWVSNADITEQLRAVGATRVLVVADSCYSGTLTRDVSIRPPDADYLSKIIKRRARQVVASGGNEPVADGGPGGHSVFAHAFLDALSENKDVLETTRLFDAVRERVLDSEITSQVPSLGSMRGAGDDGGEFIFQPSPK